MLRYEGQPPQLLPPGLTPLDHAPSWAQSKPPTCSAVSPRFPTCVFHDDVHDYVHRVYGGAAHTLLWVALGSWVAVFPGTLEKLFGLGYDFHDDWGVSRKVRGGHAWHAGGDRGVCVDRLGVRPVRERQLDLPLTGPPVAGEAAG